MSNAVFPTLQGEAWPRVKTPKFNTSIQRSDSLRRWAVARALYPVYTYRLVYTVLDQTDFNTLCAFFKARKGSFDTFLLDDRDDNTVVTPQTIGVGDGSTKKFQLLRSLNGFVEPVGPPNGVPTIRVNSVATGAYTIDDYGLVTLTAAPAAGQVVDWTGQFYWRCAFVKDEAQFEEFVRQLWELKQIEMETIKP
jgi:uncharacterized protein (TIGR02217 family)